MKALKRFLVGGMLVLVLSATSVTAFAAVYKTPAEAAAGITGKAQEAVVAERQSGKSYGSIASEAGKLEEFQRAMLDIFRERLDARVANGTMTQAEADAALAAMKERQATCDGTGTGNGAGLKGSGCGLGRSADDRGLNKGAGMGRGSGRGMGLGMGQRNGSCLNQ